METILIILTIILGLFLFVEQIRLFYNRYLRTYGTEITNFLSSKGFELIETRYPNNADWSGSPFSKPPKIEFLLAFVKINGRIVSWTNLEYLIVEGEKQQNHREFWIEIKTTYFQKPILAFRDGRTITKKEINNLKQINFVKVKDKCPACGFRISENDKSCPDCGLNYE